MHRNNFYSYLKKRLRSNGLPSWLSYSSAVQTFAETPQKGDQAFTGQANTLIPITATLTFPNSIQQASSTTFFNIKLEGNSTFENVLEYIGYASPAITFLIFLYRNRRYYFSDYKKTYLKIEKDGVVGQPFFHDFSVHRERIRRVQILLPESSPKSCCDFIENLESYDLPAAGLDYNFLCNKVETNALSPLDKLTKEVYI